MRVCLVSQNRFHNDRKAMVAYQKLVEAGHEVAVVAVDDSPPIHPVTLTVSRRIGSDRKSGALLRRLIPASVQDQMVLRRLSDACVSTGADIFIPLQAEMLDVAVSAARHNNATVQRAPGMSDPGSVDLITLAPRHPELALPVKGMGRAHTPDDDRHPYQPTPDRHRGRKAVLCYRKTMANPGRYIEEAMLRSGLEVRLETDYIDLGTVDPMTEFVMFVEGPYPALEVTGNTDVPVLFWVHHGEHHLHPNLRLTDRYRADAVLLAHSWHLAPWFPTTVHRFPFAVPVEHCHSRIDLADRSYEVSMVGSKLKGEAWQYEHRRRIVASIEDTLGPERTRFVEGVSPEDMFELYGQSKVVLNEGGTRHYPITMRVFEAIGSRSALLTDTAPGLEMLFEPDHYAVLEQDVMSVVHRLLDDLDTTQTMASAGHEHALGLHTYDHRIDELLEIARTTEKRDVRTPVPRTELAKLIDRDVEVQRLVHSGIGGLADELPGREIWPISERQGRMDPATMDAAVITRASALQAATMLDMARLYIYASGDVSDLDEYLSRSRRGAAAQRHGDYVKVDLGAESYRVDRSRGQP